jgi:hypothetical protein
VSHFDLNSQLASRRKDQNEGAISVFELGLVPGMDQSRDQIAHRFAGPRLSDGHQVVPWQRDRPTLKQKLIFDVKRLETDINAPNQRFQNYYTFFKLALNYVLSGMTNKEPGYYLAFFIYRTLSYISDITKTTTYLSQNFK